MKRSHKDGSDELWYPHDSPRESIAHRAARRLLHRVDRGSRAEKNGPSSPETFDPRDVWRRRNRRNDAAGASEKSDREEKGARRREPRWRERRAQQPRNGEEKVDCAVERCGRATAADDETALNGRA